MSKAYLTRSEILEAKDIKTEDVEVPEWNGTVCVKAMNGTERDDFEASMLDNKHNVSTDLMHNLRAKLVAKTVVDPETMETLFTVADIETLGKKSAAALDRIFTVAQRLSKITESDVKDLTKN